MSVKFSIIIPVYNSQKYLDICLNSVCKEIKKDIEVIIIDDCSNDGSINICRKFARKFNYIKLIKLKKNKGVSYCRNIGINKANGDFIGFVDSDDKLSKGSIKLILKHLNRFNENDVFILKNLILDDHKKQKGTNDYDQTFKFKKNKSIISCIRKINKFRFTCWNLIVKRKFLKTNKILFKDIQTAEDWLFVSEIFCLLKSYYFIKTPVYLHRTNELETLGKKNGYIRVNSLIKLICEISKFINKKKNFLNKEKILLLSRMINLAVQELFCNVVICNKKEIKKISSSINKSKKTLLMLSKFGLNHFNFLFEKNKSSYDYLCIYNKRKNKLIKNFFSALNNKNIISFCVGQYGRIALKYFIKIGVNVRVIVDNNITFKYNKIENFKIKQATYLKQNLKKFLNFTILVCNKNLFDFKKIKLQLIKIGYLESNIVHFKLL